MGWSETRAQSRLRVHARFAVPATYTAPTPGAVPVSCQVRVHTRIARFADLDREGYAEVIEDINRIVFLQCEVTPERKGLVTLMGRPNSSFTIDLVVPPDDATIVVCEVKPKGLTK